MKAAILDFNRTLFDPDSSAFIEGTIPLLYLLKSRGIKLVLISLEEKGRTEQIKPISSYFDFILLPKEKTREEFQKVLQELRLPAGKVVVIGDYVREEITFGNQLGMTTIRVKQGKYASMTSTIPEEQATVTVSNLYQVISFLNNIDMGGN